jgi:hypothetical protein
MVIPIPETLEAMLGQMAETAIWTEQPRGTLYAPLVAEIEEALQDKREAEPEDEFYVNALEHLRTDRFRLAVVEAVVCLEIVLARFLTVYLEQVKGMEHERATWIVAPEQGLTMRVGALLDLMLEKADLLTVDRKVVLKVVSWRNAIAHRTGRLPDNVSEDEVRQALSLVFKLISLLVRKRREIELQPKADAIAAELREAHALNSIVIAFGLRHFVFALVYIDAKMTNDAAAIGAFVTALEQKLVARDRRFSAAEDLHVKFMSLGRSVGECRAGVLEITPISPVPSIFDIIRDIAPNVAKDGQPNEMDGRSMEGRPETAS